MGTAESILVVVLAAALAIFLILSIVAAISLIKILKHINRITEKAEQIADKAEAVTNFFEKTAGPVALGKLLSNIADSVFKKGKSNKNSKE